MSVWKESGESASMESCGIYQPTWTVIKSIFIPSFKYIHEIGGKNDIVVNEWAGRQKTRRTGRGWCHLLILPESLHRSVSETDVQGWVRQLPSNCVWLGLVPPKIYSPFRHLQAPAMNYQSRTIRTCRAERITSNWARIDFDNQGSSRRVKCILFITYTLFNYQYILWSSNKQGTHWGRCPRSATIRNGLPEYRKQIEDR